MKKIDAIDRQILNILQADAKTNVKQIAQALSMSKTPIYERIKRLENEGIIDKYVAILDRKKLAPSMIVFCTVTLDVQKLEQIKQFNKAISEIPEVIECYLMGGVFDFLLKVAVSDLYAYHQFSSDKLASLPHVSKIQSSFVLDEVKHATVYPV